MVKKKNYVYKGKTISGKEVIKMAQKIIRDVRKSGSKTRNPPSYFNTISKASKLLGNDLRKLF